MFDLKSHYLCLYYNCPRRDSEAQTYCHQGKKEWIWLPACKPCAWDYYFIQICGQGTNQTWAIWIGCDAQWTVDRGWQAQPQREIPLTRMMKDVDSPTDYTVGTLRVAAVSKSLHDSNGGCIGSRSDTVSIGSDTTWEVLCVYVCACMCVWENVCVRVCVCVCEREWVRERERKRERRERERERERERARARARESTASIGSDTKAPTKVRQLQFDSRVFLENWLWVSQGCGGYFNPKPPRKCGSCDLRVLSNIPQPRPPTPLFLWG